MEADNQGLSEYLSLIKKITGWKIKDPNHYGIKEDVVQEAFLKLFRADFFNKHDFHNEEEQKKITAYVSKTVHSCYMDQLKRQGYIRHLTKSEKESEGTKYKNINIDQIEDVIGTDEAFRHLDTPDQYVFIKEAYQRIKHCYEFLSAEIHNIGRQKFFYAAFWRFDDYRLPMNKLATHLGYKSTNPTQELNRFVTKVSKCTEPHGISVTNPHEQIQFLREQIENSGTVS
jgi:DNA-directed RNA polymerase specialized sigma24 family protein